MGSPPLSDLPETATGGITFIPPRVLCQRHGLRPHKFLGQNFLRHPEPARRIVAALELQGTETVVEIGAGLGALTIFLAPAAKKVIAIEYDPRLAAILQQDILGSSPNVTVLVQDALAFDWEAVSRENGQPLTVVGNLPYQITSPLLFKLAAVKKLLRRAVLMVQKEVAERLLAAPGQKDYGILTILLSYHFKIDKIFNLGPKNFYPEPKVAATVLRLEPWIYQPEATDEALLTAMVRLAFATRRKILRNALVAQADSLGTTPEILLEGLARLGINPKRRAETLSVADYVRLTNFVAAKSRPPGFSGADPAGDTGSPRHAP